MLEKLVGQEVAAEIMAAASKYQESQEQLKKYIGRSVKLQIKTEPQPFYFKIMGYSFNGQSFWGIDDEGQKRLIMVKDLEELKG
jgi:hypothetical protein